MSAQLQEKPAVNLDQSRLVKVSQNTHILESLDSAWAAVDSLVMEGFTVLSVWVNGRKPIISIQACLACENLCGQWFRRDPSNEGVFITWQVELLGCQVQWQTREAS